MNAGPISTRSSFPALVPWIALAALAGAAEFVLVQKATGAPLHIAEFMGSQIVQQGGYSPSLAGAIGWGVHLGVSSTYATLFVLLSSALPRSRGARWGAGAVLAVLLGWLTTLLTAPAIAVTIGVLSGGGLPARIPGLNTSFGVPFWNHVGFFAVLLIVAVVARDLVGSRGAAREGTTITATAA